MYPEIQNKFYECFKKKIFSCYGITELGGALTIQNLLNCDVEGCVGEIKRNIKIKINKKKEILINTSFKMVGYLKDKKFSETNKFNNKKYFNL